MLFTYNLFTYFVYFWLWFFLLPTKRKKSRLSSSNNQDYSRTIQIPISPYTMLSLPSNPLVSISALSSFSPLTFLPSLAIFSLYITVSISPPISHNLMFSHPLSSLSVTVSLLICLFFLPPFIRSVLHLITE